MNPAPAPRQSVPACIRGRLAWQVIRTAGGASRGLSLGLRRGFASAASMDHLYANRPAGFTVAGRWLDRVYLRSPGIAALRWREQSVRQRVASLLEKHHEKKPCAPDFRSPCLALLDLGCGSCHVLQAFHNAPGSPDFKNTELSAILIDHDSEALEEARARLDSTRSSSRICFVHAQAAATENWNTAPASVDVAVTAGLLELLSDEDVRTIAAGMARVVKPGGAWVVTAMPTHPDEALVRRCPAHNPLLHNHSPQGDTNPLVFSVRSCEALSELLAGAGWVVADWKRSPTGITAVGVAVRCEKERA